MSEETCTCGRPLLARPGDLTPTCVECRNVPDACPCEHVGLARLRHEVDRAGADDRPAVAARVVAELADAGMDEPLRFAVRRWIKDRKLIPMRDLDAMTRRRALISSPARGSAQHAHLHTPPELARQTDILTCAADCAHKRMGLVGEDQVFKTEYLMFTSRLLAKPVSGVIKGLSSSGKSFVTECAERLMPDEAKLVITAMSERALVYMDDGEFRHRTVVLYESVALREGREKTDDNATAYLVRSLLSEGCIRYPTVVKSEDGRPHTVWIVREGPTNLLTTTTSISLHAENETRMLSLDSDDSEAQTKAVMLAECDDDDREAPDLQPWHALQCWLAQANHAVVIPFGRCVASQIPPKAARLRRDWRSVRSLIRAHAMLHQLSRETDDRGRVVATIEDYEAVHGLVADVVAEGVGATVKPTVSETVGAVEDLQPAKVTEVAAKLGIERSSAQRRLATAARNGYIANVAEKGQAAQYALADPLPEDTVFLPGPGGVCSTGTCTHHSAQPESR